MRFAQLKAAVAATEAARQLGDSGANQRDPDEAYSAMISGRIEANRQRRRAKSTATPEVGEVLRK